MLFCIWSLAFKPLTPVVHFEPFLIGLGVCVLNTTTYLQKELEPNKSHPVKADVKQSER